MTQSHSSTAVVLDSQGSESGAREGRRKVMDNAKYSDCLVFSATIGVKNILYSRWGLGNGKFHPHVESTPVIQL